MRSSSINGFLTLKVEGALLPPDLIRRIVAGKGTVPGSSPVDYHLSAPETINEAVSRAWNRMAGLWVAFNDKRGTLIEGDHGISMTREQWLLPLFQELGFGRLQTAKPYEFEGEEVPYRISHLWGSAPIHLLGCGVPLDRRTKGVAGAAKASPHGLVQEFLNRSADHLWGIVSNGLKLRLLRDNVSLTRQAYVEFDIEAIMEGEVYPDFLVLWMLCHQSRFESAVPEECFLEKWHQLAAESGIRILENLRSGVENAITRLGEGFLKHEANKELIQSLRSGTLKTLDFYRQLLRLVYRMIFLLVAENRELLLVPGASQVARERYMNFYSLSRLRELAEKRRGGRHSDLWQGLQLVFKLLGTDDGYDGLGLPGLGSYLWSHEAVKDLEGCLIANRHLLEAVYSLTFFIDNKVRHAVDYRNLGPEELGSVYEALLEQHPEVDTSGGTFELKTAGGSERKTTGSYYTPSPLIVSLLETALDPVLKKQNTEQEILSLKICDPACGSGHFLLAAAHRVGRKLAKIRTHEVEPAPETLRTAVRDVIGHCLYGVDINPMSVELCKVSLWMEALEPGKPLSFLDHRILCGNSLMGAYPALMKKGIPDEAFKPIEGDDKKTCQKYRELNKQERGGMGLRSLFDAAGEGWFGHTDFSMEFVNLDAVDDSTMEGVRYKQTAYKQMMESDSYRFNCLMADAWSAAYVWKKEETVELPFPIHEEVLRNIEKNPSSMPGWMGDEIGRLARQYGFFHFHLAFPDVFWLQQKDEEPENPHTGWSGGFDVVLGNPPWERVKLQEKEWFAQKVPEIADAPNAAARKRMIEALKTDDPPIYTAFLEDRRKAEGESHFIRNSGKFPLCGRGDVNTYTVFTETNRELIGSLGRVGCIVPSGIATDDTTKYFFQDIVVTRTLATLFDFENRKGIFPGVHRSYKFCLLTLTGRQQPMEKGAEFIFFAHNVVDLRDMARRFTLTDEEIALLNPNTHTCPIFRSKKDAMMCKVIREKTSIWKEQDKKNDKSNWNPNIRRLIDLNSNASLLKTEQELDEKYNKNLSGNFFKDKQNFLRLYEGKMINFYNHRFADSYTVDRGQRSGRATKIDHKELKSPNRLSNCRFWVNENEIKRQIPDWNKQWLFSYMDVCSVTNERTVIASIIPLSAPSFSLRVISSINANADETICLLSNFCSFIFDYYVRQFVGGLHLSDFIMYQMPVLSPSIYSNLSPWSDKESLLWWIKSRVLELTYTAFDLEGFARDVGYEGPPFVWDDERRFRLRCELDAAYFHLYGISESDADYIMDTFPIVKRKDEKTHGSYRTKEKILEIYRQMADANQTGKPYLTQLSPPPADPSLAHPVQKQTKPGSPEMEV